jgi:hypothetical protein
MLLSGHIKVDGPSYEKWLSKPEGDQAQSWDNRQHHTPEIGTPPYVDKGAFVVSLLSS